MSIEGIIGLITAALFGGGGLIALLKVRADKRKINADAEKLGADASAVLTASAVSLLAPMREEIDRMTQRHREELDRLTKRITELENQVDTITTRLEQANTLLSKHGLSA